MKNILIVDDHPIIRAGLASIIADEEELHVSHEAGSSAEMFGILKNCNNIDIVLLDIYMPDGNGFKALLKLKAMYPELPVIMLSAMPETVYALQCLRANASGFVSKETASEQLVKAIQKVLHGGIYISESLAEQMVVNYSNNTPDCTHLSLSQREFQVLLLIGSGKTITQIAEIENLSCKTINTYKTRIFKKLKLCTNSELIRFCYENGIYETAPRNVF